MTSRRPGSRPVLPGAAFARALPSADRRSFLRGLGITGLGLSAPGLLAACGTSGSKQTADTCTSTDLSSTEKVLAFSNWPAYMDVADHKTKMPTLDAFVSQTGIKVAYNTDVNANDEFFQKVQNQLGDCQPVGRDIFTLTDWMAARMIDLGWIQKLDHANLPNVDANLLSSLKGPSWDPNRDYSVPWQSGLTGLAYNAKYTGEVSSIEELITRKDLKGKISLLTEMPDTMGFMLKIVGADPANFTADEWGAALAKLEDTVGRGQVRAFTGNEYLDDLLTGNLAASMAWSGDVIQESDNPDIKWIVPEEGLAIWSDNMLVPNKADHKANAEKLMNYYYDPEVAATLAAWVNYICPVEGAQQAMEKIDPSLAESPLIFPNADFLAKTWIFQGLDETTARKYETDFSKVQGA